MEQPRPLMTLNEVARRLNCTRRNVYRLIEQGHFPVIRLNRQVRVNPELLESYIAAGGKGEPRPAPNAKRPAGQVAA